MMMRLAQDNSIMDNIDYKAKVGFVPAGDGGRVTIVLSFASESPSLLGAEVPVYARVHPLSAIFPSHCKRIQRPRLLTRPACACAQGISEWTTPSKSRRNNERKEASAPIDCGNGYGALLGSGGNEGIVGDKATSKATRGCRIHAHAVGHINSVLAACMARCTSIWATMF